VSVRWVNCGKTAEWIWVPFGVMSGVGSGIGVLDGVQVLQEKEEVSGGSGPLV